ncbi:hypothetical protein BH23CHL7_BH23CHL7_15540 [soil metagenome]
MSVYENPAQALRDVWVAVRASLHRVLETTSLADLAGNDLPPRVRELTADPEAWISMNRRRRASREAAHRCVADRPTCDAR